MVVRRGYLLLFLLFITLGIYYPSIFGGINPVDDIQIITTYINVEKFDLKALFIPSASSYYYRPILGLTFIFDKIFWEMHESFMHLENIILHAFNVVLVFLISEKIAKRYLIFSGLLPLAAAFFFAVHPVNTESVNWIAGRTDLLSGFFLLLSLLLLLTSLEHDSNLFSVASISAFLLSCMSKEVAVSALPGLLAIIFFYDQKGSILERFRRRWVSAGSLLAIAIVFFLLLFRFLVQARGDSGIKVILSTLSSSGFDLIKVFSLLLTALGFYTKKLFIPWPLNFAIVQISGYYFYLGLFVLFASLYIFVRKGLLSAFTLVSICLITPPLLIAVARITWTPFAERYLYMTCATSCTVITVYVYKAYCRSELIPKVLLSILSISTLITMIYSTVNRNIIWQNNISLLRETLRLSPEFYLVQNALAHSLKQAERFDESRALTMSIIAPEGSKRGGKLIDSNQAMILAARGDYAAAKQLLLRNIDDAGAQYPRILENLINVNMQMIGQEKKITTIKALREEIISYLLKLYDKTADPFYYYRIGQFYLGIGNKEEAQSYFSKAFFYSPDGAYYKPAAKKLAEKLKQ